MTLVSKMIIREYRILMPISVNEYRRGQCYMIARAELEATLEGDAILLMLNEPCYDQIYGSGKHQIKRFYLSRHIPSWLQHVLPTTLFYVTEESWSYYPHFSRSIFTTKLIPQVRVEILCSYINDSGTTYNALGLSDVELSSRQVMVLDVVTDKLKNKPKQDKCHLDGFRSENAGRGPFSQDWSKKFDPVMCSYKVIKSHVDFIGINTKAETAILDALREVLLKTHIEAVLWLDEWYDITEGELVQLEKTFVEDTAGQAKSLHNIVANSKNNDNDNLEKTATPIKIVSAEQAVMTGACNITSLAYDNDCSVDKIKGHTGIERNDSDSIKCIIGDDDEFFDAENEF